MEVLYELGVDISSDLSFQNGDLKLVSYDDNLVQSIANRLNTQLNELSLFYEDYGSVMSNYVGWKANDETLSLIGIEIDTVLKNEPRILDFESNVSYNQHGEIIIELTVYPNQNTSIDVNLVLNEFGITIEENGE